MKIYEELVARGLIAQVTDEERIKELINNGQATFYIGFDPTADSLHVGHFMALCLMKRLQMAGNKPIALLGGGTGMIGDPSGKTEMRKMLTKEATRGRGVGISSDWALQGRRRGPESQVWSCHGHLLSTQQRPTSGFSSRWDHLQVQLRMPHPRRGSLPQITSFSIVPQPF